MAAFDPTIQVGVQNSGIPPMGSPPNLLTLSAGSYLGHFISSMSIKKDTDARNRGIFFAHEHIAAIQGDIVKEKNRTILNPDFDTTYNSFVSEKLGSVASKQKYEPQNETERLAYVGVIESYKQREYASSFVESAKAYKENAVGMLNQNLATYMEGYHAANPNELAAIRNDIATALASASSSENGNIPITTPSAAREHHTKLIRQGEMSRIMNSASPREMIDLLHNPDASVVSPVYDPKTNTFTNSYAMQRLLPAEKEMMMEYVAKKQDKTLALEASARKIDEERSTLIKNAAERAFYNSFQDPTQPQVDLSDMRAVLSPSQVPVFSGAELNKMEKDRQAFIDAQNEGPKVSDPTAMMRMWNRIYRVTSDGTLDTSNYHIPTPGDIYAQKDIKASDKAVFVSATHNLISQRTDRSFTDYQKRFQQGITNLRATLRVDSLVPINGAPEFFADIQNEYFATMNAMYGFAVSQGQPLSNIDGNLVANKILSAKGKDFFSIVYPNMMGQFKTLSNVAKSIPQTSYKPTDGLGILRDTINAKVESGAMTQAVGIKMRMMVDNGIANNVTMEKFFDAASQDFALSIGSQVAEKTGQPVPFKGPVNRTLDYLFEKLNPSTLHGDKGPNE